VISQSSSLEGVSPLCLRNESLFSVAVEKDSHDQVDKTVVLSPAVQLLQEGLDMIALQQPQQHPGLENGMQN